MALKIDIESREKGVYVVKLDGNVDEHTYLDLKNQLRVVVDQKAKSVLMDMAGVEYVSSIGLGVLFSLSVRLGEGGGKLLFANLKPQVKKVFEIIRGIPADQVFSSSEDADRYLEQMAKKK